MARPRTLSIADVLGSRILSADGRRIGHVVDLRVDPQTYAVSDLLVGHMAWLRRLRVYRGTHKPHAIPWSAVKSFDRYTIRLGEDAKLPAWCR